MIQALQKPLLSKLDDRRRSLGITLHDLAERSGVSLPTVMRILSGKHPQASWANVLAIAHTLGLNVEFKPVAEVEDLRARQAARKADEIVRMIQSTSALESQAVDESQLQRMREQTVHELLAGSNRKLWAK